MTPTQKNKQRKYEFFYHPITQIEHRLILNEISPVTKGFAIDTVIKYHEELLNTTL
jgi:hypothetical protein